MSIWGGDDAHRVPAPLAYLTRPEYVTCTRTRERKEAVPQFSTLSCRRKFTAVGTGRTNPEISTISNRSVARPAFPLIDAHHRSHRSHRGATLRRLWRRVWLWFGPEEAKIASSIKPERLPVFIGRRCIIVRRCGRCLTMASNIFFSCYLYLCSMCIYL